MSQLKNKKPEKIVEAQVMSWAKNNNFWLHVIEAKAHFSVKAQRYTKRSSAPKGFPDLVGVGPGGIPVFIELKAPGKMSTVRPEQAQFLKDAVLRGSFALVADSETHIECVYKTWISIQQQGGMGAAIGYLLRLLGDKS